MGCPRAMKVGPHTHTQMKIFFEATKNAKIYILPSSYCDNAANKRRQWQKREVCRSFLSSNDNGGGLLK
jgi:hypothetical protein